MRLCKEAKSCVILIEYISRSLESVRLCRDARPSVAHFHINIMFHVSNSDSPPRWRRGSGLDFGSEDPGSIPRLPSPRVGPLMARR